MKKTKKLKPYYIFCIVSIIVLIVSYAVYLLCVGGSYKVYFHSVGEPDMNTIKVELSDENIVKIKDIHIETFHDMLNEVVIETESIGSGDVTLSVKYQTAYEDRIRGFETSLHVTKFGLIYDTLFDSFNGLWMFNVLVDAIMIVLIITFSISFTQKEWKGEFTYPMVAWGGIVFFLTVNVLYSIYNILGDWQYRNLIYVDAILDAYCNINFEFVAITIIPFMLFAVALSFSNIQLVRHEGFRIQNLLGFLLGFAAIGGIIMIYMLGKGSENAGSETGYYIFTVIRATVSLVFSYLECMLISTVFCALASTRYKIKQPMDYIIILGCAIRSDGSPTPILRGRIDRALTFEREQYEKFHKHAKFVPSGGQGSDEVVSEAESMKRYLMEQGIPESQILKEDKSVNTYQNMAFSKKVIESDTDNIENVNIAFSTTNYHVFRGYTLAQKLGMTVKGLSAKTKLYFFPNAFLREFIGLLWEQKKKHIIFLTLCTLFLATLYLIVKY